MNKSLFTLLFSLFFYNSFGQSFTHCLVYFKDKNQNHYSLKDSSILLTEKAIKRREKENIKFSSSDLPVSHVYTDSLKKLGYQVWLKSKWLNAVVVVTDTTGALAINQLGFVNNYFPLGKSRKYNPLKYLNSNNQILNNLSKKQNQMLGTDLLIKEGYLGQGVTIALLDGGFNNAQNIGVFDTIFKNNRVLFDYNFVDKNQTSVYLGNSHGSSVLSCIAANDTSKMVSPAYKSEFILLQTEDNYSESHLEEFNWLVAAELADSMGADIINSSLGYYDFDNSFLNYDFSQFDGKTTLIAQAASIASSKGILVVSSVGNEGQNYWAKLCTPSDVEETIAVGAVDLNNQIANFSSPGPTADNRLKPDVVAPGNGMSVISTSNTVISGNGTSFSAPLITGLLASFWSKYPQLTKSEIKALLLNSGDKVASPNYNYGNGLPSYSRMNNLVLGLYEELVDTIAVYYLPNLDKLIVKSENEMLDEIMVYSSNGKLLKNQKLDQIKEEINVDELTLGVYIVKVSDKKGKVFVSKLMLMR